MNWSKFCMFLYIFFNECFALIQSNSIVTNLNMLCREYLLAFFSFFFVKFGLNYLDYFWDYFEKKIRKRNCHTQRYIMSFLFLNIRILNQNSWIFLFLDFLEFLEFKYCNIGQFICKIEIKENTTLQAQDSFY